MSSYYLTGIGFVTESQYLYQMQGLLGTPLQIGWRQFFRGGGCE
jgi:hypothetical protein